MAISFLWGRGREAVQYQYLGRSNYLHLRKGNSKHCPACLILPLHEVPLAHPPPQAFLFNPCMSISSISHIGITSGCIFSLINLFLPRLFFPSFNQIYLTDTVSCIAECIPFLFPGGIVLYWEMLFSFVHLSFCSQYHSLMCTSFYVSVSPGISPYEEILSFSLIQASDTLFPSFPCYTFETC